MAEERNNPRCVCKVCGMDFQDQELLKEHTFALHEPKRIVTATEVIQKAFDGKINFPKTKAEMVRQVEENKERKTIPLEVLEP